MHTVIVTFDLTDMSDARYREVCAELAPAFAQLPGLLAKVWLADADAATYGGVYFFRDSAAADGFAASALFRTVANYPHFRNVTARRFDVDGSTTRRTQPGVTIVQPDPAPDDPTPRPHALSGR